MTNNFDLIAHFERFGGHGNGLIIKGRVRSGKTYLVSIMARLLLESGFSVIANVRFHESVYEQYPDLHYIINDKEFFEAFINIPDDKPIVLIFDDAQASEGFKSTHVAQKSGDSLSKFLIFIGKFEANYIYIAHQKYIPSALLDGFEPLFIYKLARETFHLCKTSTIYESNYDIKRNSYVIPVPPPKYVEPLPILSKAIAKFSFETDLEGLYNHLADYRIGERLKEGTREFLDLTEIRKELQDLKDLTFEDIATAIFLKRGNISSGKKMREIISDVQIKRARDKLKDAGLI